MKKGVKIKYINKDIQNINKAFYNKVEEYSKLSLEELKDLFPKLGGSYREACLRVVEDKLRQLKSEKLSELAEGIEQEKSIEEAIIVETDKQDINE